jgi:hypothetical protein
MTTEGKGEEGKKGGECGSDMDAAEMRVIACGGAPNLFCGSVVRHGAGGYEHAETIVEVT